MENKKDVKKITGIVVSDKMEKTVVVKVDRLKSHRLYKKKYKVSKKYKAHDPENQYRVGDKVVIIETKPISRDKNWIIEDKLNASKKVRGKKKDIKK